jgi:uncharacterized membrane protein
VDDLNLNDIKKRIIHKHSSNRFIEIDMLRGIAIILMIFGHILWDLDYFGMVPMNSGIYSALHKTVPPLFFLLVGIGLIVSKKKIENKTLEDEKKYYKRLFERGLKIFGLGMIITIGSLIFMPERVVFFGVLHCIGLSVVLSAPFLKYRNYALLFAMLFIFAGTLMAQYPVENPTIFHLTVGLHQADVWRYTVDYFPLLPWFGISLLGIAIGDRLYCGNKRRFRMPDLSRYRPAKLFQWAGQHSLGLYLLHQPIIAGALAVFMVI